MEPHKDNRLIGYDYSQNGAYFVTICSHNRRNLFWRECRVDPCGRPKVTLSHLGQIAEETLQLMQEKYHISVDKYVIMPNHIHMIIGVYDDNQRLTARVNPTLSQIVGAYKSLVSSRWLDICKSHNSTMGTIWQRSFHDHIIRSRRDYEEIWTYIDNNPKQWELDEYHTI